jgi:hypothetical protein
MVLLTASKLDEGRKGAIVFYRPGEFDPQISQIDADF